MKIENCKFAGITSKIIITVMIFVLSAMPAHAKLVFTNDVFDNEAEIFRIGEGDDASGTDLSLQFGSTSTETLGWDSANSWFEVTDDFSLEGYEIKDVLLDNQGSAPGSPSAGQIYYNTGDVNTYVYNGSGWEDVTTVFDTTIAVVQARNTAGVTLTVADTWYDIPFLAPDVETDTAVLERNDTNTERIDIKETGTYRITYHVTISDTANHTTQIGVRANSDASVLNGSYLTVRSNADEYYPASATFLADLTASDYIRLQANGSVGGNLVINTSLITVQKLETVDGEAAASAINTSGTTSNTFTIDNDDTGGNVALQFGTSLAETLTWDNTNSEFDLSDDLSVNGNINHYGTIFTLDADNTGSGANVDIVAEQGSDNNGTLRYNATANQWEISNDGGAFEAILTGGGSASTLDSAYDYGGAGAGRSMNISSGAVELTVSDTDNNAALILNQNDTTNNPNTLEITNTGSGFGLLVDSGDGIFDEDVVVGGSTARTPGVTGFSMNGDDLFVAGTAGVEGNIYTDGGYNIGDDSITLTNTYIRETGNLVFQADGETDDYIHLNTTTDEEYLYFEDAGLAYTNDPGFRLNSTSGELEYRDEDESAWSTVDSLLGGGGGGTNSLDDMYNNGHTVTVDAGAVDLNGTGEVLEIGDGTAADSYITFDDGTNRQLGWDDYYSANHTGGTFSTFDQQLGFRTLQSSDPPVACGSTYSGMQWMDTDTGILYICDTTEYEEDTYRNKWLSVHEKKLFGDESETCNNGSDPDSNDNCNVDWGNGLGPDANSDLGLYIPRDITITGYGFSEDNDACAGTLDVEVWSTGNASNDNDYTLEQEIATGLSEEAENSNMLNKDINGNQYILWGIDNNCGGGVDDFNVILYFRYRHD